MFRVPVDVAIGRLMELARLTFVKRRGNAADSFPACTPRRTTAGATAVRAALVATASIAASACAAASQSMPPEPPALPAEDVDELTLRKLIRDRVTGMLQARDFAGLDRLAAENTEGRLRSPSGTSNAYWYYSALYDYLKDGFDKPCSDRAREYAEDWLRRFPNSPPAIIANASIYIKIGFCARGEGMADTVNPEAWPIFESNIAKAVEILEANKDAGSKDPEWYIVMQDLVKTQGWSDQRIKALHAEAVSRFSWDEDIYIAASQGHLPKWGGSIEEFDRFARQAAEASRETGGGSMYARIYWNAQNDFYGDLRNSNVDMDRLRASFRDFAARHPTSWNYQSIAYILCRNDPSPEAKIYLNRLMGGPDHAPPMTESTAEACKKMERYLARTDR